jgi:hypothetical protein
MPKRAVIAAALAVSAASCGSSTKTVTVTVTAPDRSATTSVTTPATAPAVLSIPTVGGFYGRCPRGAPAWTLRFVVPAASASEIITSTIGGGSAQRTQVDPGQAATFHLTPSAAHARQPADPMSGHRATTVATTQPLDVHISQATEPQSLRLDVHLALTTIGGESGQCALADSRVNARTYDNGPQ